MSKSNIDYSELVQALQKNEEGEINEPLEDLLSRLKDYMQVVLDASKQDAEECVQQAFLNVYEQIKKDNIRDEKYIFRYMIQACRHEYYRLAKEKKRFNNPVEDHQEHMVEPAEQFKNLMDKDRQKILEACLNELRKKSKKFIEYFIDKPDASTKQASAHFDISGSNVRVKKSRILSRLHHCYKRKWRQ